MKQPTSFGTHFGDGIVPQDAILMHNKNIHTLKKKGEMVNDSFGSDDTTAVPGSMDTPERDSLYNNDATITDNQEDDDNDGEEEEEEAEDVPYSNESDANDDNDNTIEDEIDTWLNYLRTDIKSLASSIRSTAGGVAHFVHRSAINVVNEIKSLDHIDDDYGDDDDDDDVEINLDGDDDDAVEESRVDATIESVDDAKVPKYISTNILGGNIYPLFGSTNTTEKLLLPWEIQNDSTTPTSIKDDAVLKQRILQMSQNDENILSKNYSCMDEILIKNAINAMFDGDTSPVHDLIHDLLKYDPQLLHVHTQHQFDTNRTTTTDSMRMSNDEKNFWYKYFYACTMERNRYLSEIAVSVIPTKLVVENNDNMGPPKVIERTDMTPSPKDTENDDDDGDDDDDDDDSYICLANVPKAPFSSSMKSIDSMVFVENVSPSSPNPVVPNNIFKLFG